MLVSVRLTFKSFWSPLFNLSFIWPITPISYSSLVCFYLLEVCLFVNKASNFSFGVVMKDGVDLSGYVCVSYCVSVLLLCYLSPSREAGLEAFVRGSRSLCRPQSPDSVTAMCHAHKPTPTHTHNARDGWWKWHTQEITWLIPFLLSNKITPLTKYCHT